MHYSNTALAVQLTSVSYSTRELNDWKGKNESGSVVFRDCNEDSDGNETFTPNTPGVELKWKHLSKLKIDGKCNAYIMNSENNQSEHIDFTDSYKDFPKMTLLAMILVNERALSDNEPVENKEQLISSLEKYRNEWNQKPEKGKGKGSIWFIVEDGTSGMNAQVFKHGSIDILNGKDNLDSVNNNEEIANINLLQLQKDLKDGTPRGDTPKVQFRNQADSGISKLTYINFKSETS